jgi:hypothetical protein
MTFGPPTDRIRLILVFRDEEDKQDTRIEGQVPDAQTAQITFFNFKSALGQGSIKPLELGTLDGRKLYLHYRIYPLGNSDKTFHYTLYRAEEIGDRPQPQKIGHAAEEAKQ